MQTKQGRFGFGWTTKYDESLAIGFGGGGIALSIRYTAPEGKETWFNRENADNPFIRTTPGVDGQIVKVGSSYRLNFHDGRVHEFDSDGRLLWQRDRNGLQTTLNYIYDTSNVLTHITVTDPVGRMLILSIINFIPNYPYSGVVSQVSDVINGTERPVATYTYFSA